MSNMKEMTLQQAEIWVDNNPRAKWDGWNIHLFTKDPSAQYSPYGVLYNGEWHKRKVIAVNERGTYVVSNNNARLSSKAGHRS